jgi:hypothetical protein
VSFHAAPQYPQLSPACGVDSYWDFDILFFHIVSKVTSVLDEGGKDGEGEEAYATKNHDYFSSPRCGSQ